MPPGAEPPRGDGCPRSVSLVVPVFNGSATVGPLVAEIAGAFADTDYEVVLVDDGSTDDSAAVCLRLVDAHPGRVTFVQLARNFGEHNAVLAGLRLSRGAHVVVLDDDGQNPPREARRLLEAIRVSGDDVVYGRPRVKQHGRLRNLGSRLTGWLATVLLRKPAGLYLSSFKVMNRFLVDELCAFRGARPYIDGLIWRLTRRIGQIEVEHRPRAAGRSNYSPRRLLRFWVDVLLNLSIFPLRIAGIVGLLCFAASGPLLAVIALDKLWWNPSVTVGVPTLLVAVVFFASLQLLILGTLGEYLGRLYLDASGEPQAVVRRVVPARATASEGCPPAGRAAPADAAHGRTSH